MYHDLSDIEVTVLARRRHLKVHSGPWKQQSEKKQSHHEIHLVAPDLHFLETAFCDKDEMMCGMTESMFSVDSNMY